MSLKKGVLRFFYITKPFNTARISPNFTHLVIASTLHIAIIRLQKVNQNNPLLAAYPKQRLEFAWFWYLGIPLARGTPSQLTIKLVRNRSQVQPGHYQDYLCHPGLKVLDYTYSNKAAILLALYFITFSSPYLI